MLVLPEDGVGTTLSDKELERELERQIEVLFAAGYSERLGMTTGDVRAEIGPLRRRALGENVDHELSTSKVPFLLVPGREHIGAEELIVHTRLANGTIPGFVDRNHGEGGLQVYEPLPELGVPTRRLYLAINVERGEEFCGEPPVEATTRIRQRQRTPLTIHEGLALLLYHPAVLEKSRCFMLAGSRRGDKRVPALWISQKAPKLGWCWEGNPHSWLGVASAGERWAA